MSTKPGFLRCFGLPLLLLSVPPLVCSGDEAATSRNPAANDNQTAKDVPAAKTEGDRQQATAILDEIANARLKWKLDQKRMSENPNALSKEAQQYLTSISRNPNAKKEDYDEVLRLDRKIKAEWAKRPPITYQNESQFLGHLTKLYDKAVSADPAFAESWHARALFRWREQKEELWEGVASTLRDNSEQAVQRRLRFAAKDDLVKAAELDPANHVYHRHLVELAEALGERDLARSHAKQAADGLARSVAQIQQVGERLNDRELLVRLRFLARQWADVVAECDALLKDALDSGYEQADKAHYDKLQLSVRRYRGLSLGALGKLDAAAGDLKASGVTDLDVVDFRIDSLEPDAALSLHLGKQRYETAEPTLENLERAIAMFARSLELDPQRGEAAYLRAKARHELRLAAQKDHYFGWVTERGQKFLMRHSPADVVADLEAAEKLKFTSPGFEELKKSAAQALAVVNLPDLLGKTREAATKLVAEQQVGQAADEWKKLADLLPDVAEVRWQRLDFLTTHAAELGVDEHRREVDTVLRLYPDFPDRRRNVCLDRLKLLRSLKHVKLYREYVEFKPMLEQLITDRETLAWVAFEAEHYEDAHRLLSAVVAEREPKHREQQDGGEKQIRRLISDEARQRLRDNLQRDELNFVRQQRQVEVLGRMIAKPNYDDYTGWTKRANAYAAAGNDMLAFPDYANVTGFEPGSKSVLARCWCAGRAIALGYYQDAQTFLDEALKLHPQSSEAYACRGALRQAQCRFDEALADYSRSIELCTLRQEAYLRRAQILFFRGELEQAFDDLAVAALIEPPAQSLLLPQHLDKPHEGSAPQPDPRIASSAPNAAAVATAQLKLARGDIDGAEADLVALGDDGLRWRELAQNVAPQPPVEANFLAIRDHQERLEKHHQSQERERTALIKSADPWRALTLGMARITRDEDQDLFQFGKHPLAADIQQTATADRKSELARWNFISASHTGAPGWVFAALFPPTYRLETDFGDSVALAYDRRIDDPYRHVPSLYRRMRFTEPFPYVSQPPFNANERFAAARRRALTPACIEDFYAMVKSLSEELKTPRSSDTDDYFKRQEFEKNYGELLLACAAKIKDIPSYQYRDPLLPGSDPNQNRVDALVLLQRELGSAGKRQSDEMRRKDFEEPIPGLEQQVRVVMNLPAYWKPPHTAFQRLQQAASKDEHAAALAGLLQLGESGNAEACNLLSLHYHRSGEFADRAKALAWLKRGAEQGHVRSQRDLGEAYYMGFLTGENLELATFWLEKAIQAGDAKAKNILASVQSQREFKATAAKNAAETKNPREKAAQDLERWNQAVKNDPTIAKWFEKRAVARLILMQDEEALKDADKCIELNPKGDDGYGLRYLALTFLGREKEAAAAKAKLKEVSPASKYDKLDEEFQKLKQLRGE